VQIVCQKKSTDICSVLFQQLKFTSELFCTCVTVNVCISLFCVNCVLLLPGSFAKMLKSGHQHWFSRVAGLVVLTFVYSSCRLSKLCW